jgi:hypothetical protein
MKTITEEEFRKIEKANPYFKGRWEYFKEVVKMVEKIDPIKVLEIGSVGCKLVKDSKVLDITNQYNGIKYEVDYLLDITKDLDKVKERFDLIICLQVLEHLGNRQQSVFSGLLERGDNIIISIPYLWTDKSELSHYNITDDIIKKWTCDKVPKEEIIIGDNKKRKIIRF